jgi:hypothetical protein
MFKGGGEANELRNDGVKDGDCISSLGLIEGLWSGSQDEQGATHECRQDADFFKQVHK